MRLSSARARQTPPWRPWRAYRDGTHRGWYLGEARRRRRAESNMYGTPAMHAAAGRKRRTSRHGHRSRRGSTVRLPGPGHRDTAEGAEEGVGHHGWIYNGRREGEMGQGFSAQFATRVVGRVGPWTLGEAARAMMVSSWSGAAMVVIEDGSCRGMSACLPVCLSPAEMVHYM
jgi:hypothetical protein